MTLAKQNADVDVAPLPEPLTHAYSVIEALDAHCRGAALPPRAAAPAE